MNPDTILPYLKTVANSNLWLNAALHIVVLAAGTVFIVVKCSFIRRLAVDTAILLLFLSMTAIAAIYGNPFHLISMAPPTILSIMELLKGKNVYCPLKLNIRSVLASVSIVAGFWYPDFVHAHPAALLFLSPAGILPCPTLLIALGFLTLAYPGVNRIQYGVLTFLGFFYGITGVLVLNVYLDVLIIVISSYSLYSLIRTSKRGMKMKSTNLFRSMDRIS